jgi:hypothetical protein
MKPFNYGYLLPKKDQVVPNAARNIAEAKAKVLELADTYVRPIPRKDINVLGPHRVWARCILQHTRSNLGNYASEHDIKIAHKIAWVFAAATSPARTTRVGTISAGPRTGGFPKLVRRTKNTGTHSIHAGKRKALAELT